MAGTSCINPVVAATSIPRYGRFVANQGFCSVGELAEIAYIPTADAKSCPVRECHQVSNYDEFDDLWRWRR